MFQLCLSLHHNLLTGGVIWPYIRVIDCGSMYFIYSIYRYPWTTTTSSLETKIKTKVTLKCNAWFLCLVPSGPQEVYHSNTAKMRKPLKLAVLSSFFFFLAQSRGSEIGCLPYFHTWCGLSVNLGCRSETCCTWLAANVGRKKSPKSRHLRTIVHRVRPYLRN